MTTRVRISIPVFSSRCPVCNTNLADLGAPFQQEAHVKACLEGGNGTVPQTAKYLVYKLPAESALIGVECMFRPYPC